MDLKSFFGKFQRKSDDDMIASDPLDADMHEPSSKFSSILGFLKKKKNADNSMELSFEEERQPEVSPGNKNSHRTTNIALLCVLVAIIGTGAYIHHENGKEKQTQTASTFQPAGKAGKKKDAETPGSPNEVMISYGNVMINPFVDLNEMRKAAKQEDSAAKKATIPPPIHSYDDGEDGEAYTSIPAIPSFTPPSIPTNGNRVRRVGSIPAPLGGSQSEAPAPAQSAPVEVQGVVMGNDGSSMAILSDGSVVETGDTYRDGRIAYIGGDGIKFDDGSSMQFKD